MWSRTASPGLYFEMYFVYDHNRSDGQGAAYPLLSKLPMGDYPQVSVQAQLSELVAATWYNQAAHTLLITV